MTRCALMLSVGLLCAASANAQTIERTIEVNEPAWGLVDAMPVEADGDPATREWLVSFPAASDLTYNTRLLVVAERLGRTCVGDWFSPPAPGPLALTTYKWVEVGGATKIQATDFRLAGQMTIRLQGLTVPACD